MKTVQEPFADLIIADPPFNIDWKYDVYIDKKNDEEFLNWNKEWISEAKRLLNDSGNLIICMGDEYAADIDVLARRALGLHRRNWIIWHYTFGQSGKLETRKGFTRSKTHVFRYVKNPAKAYFDPISVAVPSDRQLKYNDKRGDPRGKVPNDVMMFKRIAGTHKDRFPQMSTQMPIEMVNVWIKAMTKAGDVVFDPFPGSGVSLRAAGLLDRKFLGVELSPDYTRRIKEKLKELKLID